MSGGRGVMVAGHEACGAWWETNGGWTATAGGGGQGKRGEGTSGQPDMLERAAVRRDERGEWTSGPQGMTGGVVVQAVGRVDERPRGVIR